LRLEMADYLDERRNKPTANTPSRATEIEIER
jgi:hypothetical protein